MDKDEIIRMANEACQPHQILNTDLEFLERFFNLAFAAGAAHEREQCAKVCDEIAVKEWDAYKGRTEPIDRDKLYNPHIEGISDGADECAAAIRSRCSQGSRSEK